MVPQGVAVSYPAIKGWSMQLGVDQVQQRTHRPSRGTVIKSRHCMAERFNWRPVLQGQAHRHGTIPAYRVNGSTGLPGCEEYFGRATIFEA